MKTNMHIHTNIQKQIQEYCSTFHNENASIGPVFPVQRFDNLRKFLVSFHAMFPKVALTQFSAFCSGASTVNGTHDRGGHVTTKTLLPQSWGLVMEERRMLYSWWQQACYHKDTAPTVLKASDRGEKNHCFLVSFDAIHWLTSSGNFDKETDGVISILPVKKNHF